ncbi:MAG: L-lactate dehydrogenase complex protein LldF [Thermomicrobiales bacterium]|nr:L-lactate dehydrogenase complex protein LldF [Thermomicrobiales bacterium]
MAVASPAEEARDVLEHDPHGQPSTSFQERYERALGNPKLARNITRFQQTWRGNRNRSMEEIEFEELRAKLKAAKTLVTDDLDRYLTQFTTMAERAGATIHYAEDADAANRIVREISERHNVNLIAKSKSMVSEEIDLNHRMAALGIDVVETDLGEWIVQKGGERPSHIVGPALHLGREEVGTLLNRVLDRPVSLTDIDEQVHAIRDDLRPVFFEAGIGMTGANALIAETGTVMMVTNEGNGRLSSSVPPVHIVLAGIEKLIPTFDDVVTQLRVLGRSATGQRISVYTTFITGPTPGHEMHIVLVDNGRRAMRAMPEFVEALHCIRCGACANVCPPYREVSGHVFGHIYTGAIGLVVTQFHHGLDAIAKPQSLCLSCNACETVCPASIPLPRQILDIRKMVVAKKGLPVAKRVVLNVYARPRAFDLAARIGSRAQRPLQRGRFVRGRHVPVLKQQTRWRSMPALVRRPLRDLAPQGVPKAARSPVVPNGAVGKTVALFPGCMTDRLFPEQGQAIVDVLRALGARVVFPADLHCCGLPANNSGDSRHAKAMARQTIQALEKTLERIDADYIVSGSASCVATLTQDYAHIFRNEPAWKKRADALAGRVMDFTSFLDHVAQLPEGSLTGGERLAVTYHDSCQGLNALGLRREPRRLLHDVLGHEIRELEENTLCCGFGGSFGFDYPGISERLMNRKLDNAQATGAPILVTDNQGCIMHLRGGCDAAGRPLKVRHLAELVAERLRTLDPALASNGNTE